MFLEAFTSVQKAAADKTGLLKKNPLGYFVAAMLAGAFIGFGVLLSFTIGGLLSGEPYAKIVMGTAFGVALSLVVIAGAELFTGNNMLMAAGLMTKSVSMADTLKLWGICWLGNLAGSVLLALIFWGAGFAAGPVGEFIAASAAAKMGLSLVPLFLRGVLCIVLVCLAVWCGFKCKSESGKLIMIFWCLFAFITTGFEHSIANMTLLTISLLAPMEAAVSIGGYVYNLIVVTLGNMVGGILFVAIPYYLISKKKETA
ncbi:MAG: Nitrite transporter NirC [Eubacterium sp.]|uniref:formate/nitrite transporter family protein n=1 Tax=Eubacterium sp. TaxID=142586 RepID=UPI0030454DDD